MIKLNREQKEQSGQRQRAPLGSVSRNQASAN
jgi:hypothetical protein